MGKTSKGTIKRLCAIGLVLLLNGRVASGQEHGAHGAAGSLGTVEFPISCTAKAQESFTRGVALLHSFTYEESAEAENLGPDPGVEPQVGDFKLGGGTGSCARGELAGGQATRRAGAQTFGRVRRKRRRLLGGTGGYSGQGSRGMGGVAEHRTYDAFRLLRMAADHEDAAEKHAVTAGAIRPARELLGDLLMEMSRSKEALTAYRQVLITAPGRRNALKGAADAARMAGMSEKSQK